MCLNYNYNDIVYYEFIVVDIIIFMYILKFVVCVKFCYYLKERKKERNYICKQGNDCLI